MRSSFYPALSTALVLGALGVIGVVGHRHWFTPSSVVVEQVEAPAAKPVKVKKVKQTPKTVKHPAVVPVPPHWRRDCDEHGWCVTYWG